MTNNLEKQKNINLTEIFVDQIIMEKPPYRVLNNFKINQEDTVFCEVQAEQENKFEVGRLGIAEVGRHMAILGSIALAKFGGYKPPHYYLATYADITASKNYFSLDKKYKLQAKLISFSKRKGNIKAEIFDLQKKLIYSGILEYLPISPIIFSRLNKSNFINQEQEKNTDNFTPYKSIRPLEDIELRKDSCSARFSRILPEDCLGHFANYPALPAAVLAELLNQLSIMHFNYLTYSKYQKFQILRAKINAYKLAFHGDELKFTTKLANASDSATSIYSEVISINTNVKFADLVIDIIGN